MVYITGDMHGDLARFKDKAIKRLRKNDTLIVAGDFGFVWDGSPAEQKTLAWIGSRKFNTLFIEGTHDNLDLLEQYPVEGWNGGQTHVISGRLRHLLRGELFTLENDRYFVMGGGESLDSDVREPGVSWWEAEMPSDQELDAARQRLADSNQVVDYIITHQCPSSIASCMDTGHHQRVNLLTALFDQLQQQCRYKHWFFGNYHTDRIVPPYYHALYRQVLPVRPR